MAEPHQLLGLTAMAEGRLDEASRSLARAMELQPASNATRSALADLYGMLGRTRDETTQREAVAALDANRPEALVSLALAHARHGRPEAAVAALDRAGERFPGSEAVANASGRIWLQRADASGDPRAIRTALEALAPAAARETASSETLSLYGRALLLNGDLIAARAALLRATTQFPIARDVFLQLSQAEARLGRRDAAKIALAKHRALTTP